jgi:DNA polymerase-3 subunit delta
VKLTGKSIEAFFDNVDDRILGVLVYGPDAGLVRERADRLAVAVAGAVSDPFRVSEVTSDQLREEPSRLADEAATLTLGGGRRVVRFRPAGDAHADLIAALLRSAAGGGLLIAESDELGPRSALRQLFEAAGNAAALPCYRDDRKDLAQNIAEELNRRGLRLAGDARDYLADALGGDRAVTRGEIEKLVTYMGASRRGATIELADAVASIGDSAALSLEDLAFAVGDGDVATADRLTSRALQDGSAPTSILRATAKHFLRLHLVAAADGDRERLTRDLKPPVFYKYRSRFDEQVRRWSPTRLHLALARLTRAEMQCKTTGAPAETICRRILVEIASQGPKASRGG